MMRPEGMYEDEGDENDKQGEKRTARRRLKVTMIIS